MLRLDKDCFDRGLCLYVKDSTASKQLNSHKENINIKAIHLGIIYTYKPPSQSDSLFLENLLNNLSTYLKDCDKILLLGDFNMTPRKTNLQHCNDSLNLENLMSLLNCVPYVLTCQRALRAYVLTCQRTLLAYVLKCQRALRVHVLTCQLAWRANCLNASVFMCLLANVLTCLRVKVPRVPCLTCQHSLMPLFSVPLLLLLKLYTLMVRFDKLTNIFPKYCEFLEVINRPLLSLCTLK